VDGRGRGGQRGEQPAGQGDRVQIVYDPVPAGVAVKTADRASGDDRSASGAGVDAPAQHRAAVAQRNLGWGEEVVVLTTGGGHGVGVDRLGRPSLGGEDAQHVTTMGNAQSGPRRWWEAVAGVEVEHDESGGLAGDADVIRGGGPPADELVGVAGGAVWPIPHRGVLAPRAHGEHRPAPLGGAQRGSQPRQRASHGVISFPNRARASGHAGPEVACAVGRGCCRPAEARGVGRDCVGSS
jgi:hypothetical protein